MFESPSDKRECGILEELKKSKSVRAENKEGIWWEIRSQS